MEKFILLLLSSFVGFAQQSIELKLVNDNIGTPFYNSMAGIYGENSNDAGLNAILLNHNVMTYADKGINYLLIYSCNETLKNYGWGQHTTSGPCLGC